MVHTWPLRNVSLCIRWIPELAIISLEHVILAVGGVLSFPGHLCMQRHHQFESDIQGGGGTNSTLYLLQDTVNNEHVVSLHESVNCTWSGVRRTPPNLPMAVPSSMRERANTPLPATREDFTSISAMLHPIGRFLMDQASKMAHAAACPGNRFNAVPSTGPACVATGLPLESGSLENLAFLRTWPLGMRVMRGVQHGMGQQCEARSNNTRACVQQRIAHRIQRTYIRKEDSPVED